MKTKILSKENKILYESENDDTTLRDTVIEAVTKGIDLSGANLDNAYLWNIDLCNAILCNATLRNADLSGAYLFNTDLCNANLSNVNLQKAELYAPNLYEANLSNVNFNGARLLKTNLSNSNISGANLNNIEQDEVTSFFLSLCPREGSFIGWKKCGDYIIKLLITENSQRSSSITLKCRCSEVQVLEIQNIDGTKADIHSIASNYDPDFIYKVGEIVKVDNFDDDRWEECSTGIHFFISKDIATKYSFL